MATPSASALLARTPRACVHDQAIMCGDDVLLHIIMYVYTYIPYNMKDMYNQLGGTNLRLIVTSRNRSILIRGQIPIMAYGPVNISSYVRPAIPPPFITEVVFTATVRQFIPHEHIPKGAPLVFDSFHLYDLHMRLTLHQHLFRQSRTNPPPKWLSHFSNISRTET